MFARRSGVNDTEHPRYGTCPKTLQELSPYRAGHHLQNADRVYYRVFHGCALIKILGRIKPHAICEEGLFVEDNVEELVWRINAATREVTTENVPTGWERQLVERRLEGKA
jgi:hypothetical protein